MDILACGEFGEFVRTDNFIALVAITFGCSIGVVGIVAGTIGGILKTRAKEMTKRELAAYVAEGTLDPENAVAMLNAGMKNGTTQDLG
jgi:hypothetical protein